MATYNSGYTKDVTVNAEITGFDSSKEGEQTVTVSYTENGVTKTSEFKITVVKTTEPVQDQAPVTDSGVKTQPSNKASSDW